MCHLVMLHACGNEVFNSLRLTVIQVMGSPVGNAVRVLRSAACMHYMYSQLTMDTLPIAMVS